MSDGETPLANKVAFWGKYAGEAELVVPLDFARDLERKLTEARTALEELIESPSPDEPEGDFGRGTTPRKRARQALARIDGNVPDQPR